MCKQCFNASMQISFILAIYFLSNSVSCALKCVFFINSNISSRMHLFPVVVLSMCLLIYLVYSSFLFKVWSKVELFIENFMRLFHSNESHSDQYSWTLFDLDCVRCSGSKKIIWISKFKYIILFVWLYILLINLNFFINGNDKCVDDVFMLILLTYCELVWNQ